MDENLRIYEAIFLSEVEIYIKKLTLKERSKIAATIDTMQVGNFDAVYTKTLRRTIKELVIKKHRLVFFINKNIIYFIHAFTKKTQKTPIIEIEIAEKLYKKIINNNYNEKK